MLRRLHTASQRTVRPHVNPLPLFLSGIIGIGALATFALGLNGFRQSKIDPTTHTDENNVMVTPADPQFRPLFDRLQRKVPTIQALTARSEQIVRTLEGTDEALQTSVAAGGKTEQLVQVTVEDGAGRFLANTKWDRHTGALLSVSHRWRPEIESPGAELTETQGAQHALYWLRRIGVIPAGEKSPAVTPRSRSRQTWTYRVRGSQGETTVSIDNRSGELVDARFKPKRR